MTPDEAVYALQDRIPIVCTQQEYLAARREILYCAIKFQFAGADDFVAYAVREMVRLDALHEYHDPYLLSIFEGLDQ